MAELAKFDIGGEWVSPHGTATMPVVDPATEEVVGEVALGNAADVDDAVAAARAAWPAFAATTREERVALLGRIMEVYAKRVRDIGKAISDEMGAPLAFAERIHAGARPGVWFNVNFPFCPVEEVAGIRVVPTQRFRRSPMKYFPSDNPGKFFIAIPETPKPLDPAHDFHLLMHGNAVTVTPVSLQATDVELAAVLDRTIAL